MISKVLTINLYYEHITWRKRDTLFKAVVSQRTVVTFVTWLISRTEFSSSELRLVL